MDALDLLLGIRLLALLTLANDAPIAAKLLLGVAPAPLVLEPPAARFAHRLGWRDRPW